MTLRTKILLTAGLLRYSTCLLILVITKLHWVGVVVSSIWLLWCRPVLRYVLLPVLFPSANCPKCHYCVPLRQFWGCAEHFKDHRPRHVLAFHCSEGHEIKYFECPRKECRATIQVQKGSDRKLRKGVVLGAPFHAAPRERRAATLRNCVRSMMKQRDLGAWMPLGRDRRFKPRLLQRWIRWLLRQPSQKVVSVPESVFGRHMTIFGKSGMGKSKLILSMVQWMMHQGHGCTVIDPAGDLAAEIIRSVPAERIEDVLWIRASDRECPFRLNVLETHDAVEEINLNDEVLSALKRTSQSWGELIAHQIDMAIDTVKVHGGSLQDVYDLFAIPEARARAIRDTDDEELREFWIEYEKMRPASRAPVIRKLRAIVKHKLLGPMLCASESNFDPDAIIRDRKIVIADLATGSTSEKLNVILGTFLVSKIVAAAFRQKFLRECERTRHFLVVDEAKNFIHRGTNFERIFSEARKYKLSLILANQHVTQLSEEVRDAAFSNAGLLVSFNVDDDDAKLFDKRMQDVSVDDFTRQEVGDCVVRIHNRTEFVKTELPRAPEEDCTAEIERRMVELNQEAFDSRREDNSDRESPTEPARAFVEVCDGVR